MGWKPGSNDPTMQPSGDLGSWKQASVQGDTGGTEESGDISYNSGILLGQLLVGCGGSAGERLSQSHVALGS